MEISSWSINARSFHAKTLIFLTLKIYYSSHERFSCTPSSVVIKIYFTGHDNFFTYRGYTHLYTYINKYYIINFTQTYMSIILYLFHIHLLEIFNESQTFFPRNFSLSLSHSSSLSLTVPLIRDSVFLYYISTSLIFFTPLRALHIYI